MEAKEELLARVANDHTLHPADTQQFPLYEANRDRIRMVAEAFIKSCPEGRELSLALTKLDEAVFWANAAIARHS